MDEQSATKCSNNSVDSTASGLGAYYKKSCICENITITNNNIVYVKKQKLRLLLSHLDKIYLSLGAKIIDTRNHDDIKNAELLSFHVFCDNQDVDIFDLTKHVQVRFIHFINEFLVVKTNFKSNS